MENNTAINLSKKIRALESSGFSTDEINEVLKQLGTANAAANNIQYGESLGSWILNFGLPSMVVLGTGALFYLLTGGEDEPAIIAVAGDNDANNDDINNDSHFLENRTGGVDGEPMPSNGNNQGANQFYDDSSAKKSSTRSTDRPFRNPASYIPDGDPEKDQNTDNMFGEASQQWLKEVNNDTFLYGATPFSKAEWGASVSYLNVMLVSDLHCLIFSTPRFLHHKQF